MKKVLVLIIVLLFILTGCTKQEITDKDYQVLNIQEYKHFEEQMYWIFEEIIGINDENYKFVTKMARPNFVTDKENQQHEIQISDVIQGESKFDRKTEIDWEKLKRVCEELENVFIDIKVQFKNENAEIDNDISRLIEGVIKKDKEITIENLNIVYNKMKNIVSELIEDENIVNIKKVKYDTILLIINLENNDVEEYEKNMNNLIEDFEKIDKVVDTETLIYLKNRIKTVINSVKNSEIVELSKYKIFVILEMTPIIEDYIVGKVVNE